MQELALSYKERLAVAWVFWWRATIIGTGVYFVAQNIIRALALDSSALNSTVFTIVLLIGILTLLPLVVGEMITRQYHGFRLRIIGKNTQESICLNYGERLTLQGMIFWRGLLNGLVTLTPILLVWVFVAHDQGIPLTTIRIAAAVFVYIAAIFLVQPLAVKEVIRVTYQGFRLVVDRGSKKESLVEFQPVPLDTLPRKRIQEVPKLTQPELI